MLLWLCCVNPSFSQWADGTQLAEVAVDTLAPEITTHSLPLGFQLDDDFRNYFANGFVAERTKLSAYTLLNMNVTYQLKDNIAVYLRIENVLDEAYTQALGYAAPGRKAFAGVRVSLGR